MLHDVGLLSVPSRILRKVDDLSDAELASIRQHPTKGAEIVRDIQFLKPALNGIEHHHERFDGRGYPVGSGRRRHPAVCPDRRRGRCVRVADHEQRDRAALPIPEALEEVERRSETQFDPVVVAALRRGLSREPWPVADTGPQRGRRWRTWVRPRRPEPVGLHGRRAATRCGAGPVSGGRRWRRVVKWPSRFDIEQVLGLLGLVLTLSSLIVVLRTSRTEPRSCHGDSWWPSSWPLPAVSTSGSRCREAGRRHPSRWRPPLLWP